MTELDQIGVYKASLERHAMELLEPGQTVEVHGLPKGAYRGRSPTAALSNAFAHHRILDPVLDNAVRAERQGFDAFVVGSYSEPFLRELRSAVDMPIVSVTEATFLVACSIGRLAAPISNDPAIARLVRHSISAHGLDERIQSPRSIKPPLNELQMAEAFSNPSRLIQSFTDTARAAIDEDADVIIPAEGVLSEFLHTNKLTQIDSVPVMDSFGVTWAYAVMMADLRSRTGLSVSRKGYYQRADPQLISELSRKGD
jgi:Asp/Glu/hydantoin racemase